MVESMKSCLEKEGEKVHGEKRRTRDGHRDRKKKTLHVTSLFKDRCNITVHNHILSAWEPTEKCYENM